MVYAKARKDLVKWLRKQLIGPFSKETLRDISPLERYPTGVLFPCVRGEEGVDSALMIEDAEDEYTETDGETNTTNAAESTVKQQRYIPPSSIGFSFFVRGKYIDFEVTCFAARYEMTGDRDDRGRFLSKEYDRVELGGDKEALKFKAPMSSHKRFRESKHVFNERAGVDVLWRPFSDGWIVTVSLCNKKEWDVGGDSRSRYRDRNEKSLFEVKLHCCFSTGEIGAYPHVDKSLLSEEEQELELQYKDRSIYAVGHGAAVDWLEEQGFVKEIWSEFMPAVEVPQVTADVGGDVNPVLGLAHLTTIGDEIEILDELDQFVAGYSNWIFKQKQNIVKQEIDEQETAERITNRMNIICQRMRRGVLLLRTDRLAAKAFQIANQAMLNQMQQFDQMSDKFKKEAEYKWRPFQLAFILTVLESSVNEDDEFRDVVDLIWFPTGGGKTEAYLGLIAFFIVWRRLKYSASGGGTTVLMRYTLRLLTVQQFERATRMICALELIRRKNPELGDEPITVGMWVGAATSPNTFAKAKENIQKAGQKGESAQKMVLNSCPWCGSVFQALESYISTSVEFHFCCTNQNCDFGKQGQGRLPCNVVDEALYEKPPTLLLATVDKFAQLAWKEETNVFFGGSNRPPELVIQDELHLIASALGSVTGLYEAAFDTILIQRGVHPKYIASTATIRMAAQQVKRLYGRKLAVFPPPGLSCDDSYFARTVPLNDRPGRLYVGYFAPMLNRQLCMAPLAAALLVAPDAVFKEGVEDRNDLLEAWWTQVVYHGSLKGVGNSHNAFDTGVRDLVRRFTEELKQNNNEESNVFDSRKTARIAQLTSNSGAEENALTFSRLKRTHVEEDCLDAVLATNMISVGLDVARLALMVINGQPLTTAEYIQASSRVGRSEVPGLVFTNYYRDQARSLSHYENFRPYHESFYRFVEPTSVTPYTYQARTRALHAALVTTIRHTCMHLLKNNHAGTFNPTDARVQKVVELLKRRCKEADTDRKKETANHIDTLVEQWYAEVKFCHDDKRRLSYQVYDNDRAKDRLLYNYGDRIKGLWPTLQSMRNVENMALLKAL